MYNTSTLDTADFSTPTAVDHGSGPAPVPEDVYLELEQLRAMQQELMRLLKCSRPDRIVHDVRNLMQENIFLEAAAKRAGI